MFHSLTSRAVARFTVDQWQAGVFRDLIAVDRVLEIRIDFVVDMATGQTVFVTYIVGVQIAYQKNFIISDGRNGLGGTQSGKVGAGNNKKARKDKEEGNSISQSHTS